MQSSKTSPYMLNPDNTLLLNPEMRYFYNFHKHVNIFSTRSRRQFSNTWSHTSVGASDRSQIQYPEIVCRIMYEDCFMFLYNFIRNVTRDDILI
jgi:hypothetical protein